MATYQTTSNRRRTAGTFTPTENRKTGVGAFTPTENRSYDSAIVYGWERQNKEAYNILEQYRSKISSGGYLSAEDLAAYKNAADIYTKTSTDLWNLSKNFGQDQKMDDASFRNSMAALQQNYTDVYNYYTQFENEAAYQEAYQANQVYQGHLNADLGQLQTEMDAMKPVMDEASEIYAQIGSFNPYAYADASQAIAAEQALKDRLAEITSPWGGYEQMQTAYSEKEQYYNLSNRYQEWAKLEDVVNNADFEAKSKFVGPSKNGSEEDGQYDVIYDEDYEYWLENHYDEWYDPNNDVYDHFTYMTPEEKAIFIYHYNTGGKTAADEYDKSIQDRQNKRWADERTKLDNGSTMAALQAHFWAAVGNLGRQIKGTWNMVTGSDEYIPTGQFEYYGANAREELADNGPKLLGHSLGQLAFDFLQNTANQAPSMAIGAVAGPGAGSAALGIGAAGNAYADMINAGYSKGQARTYATLVGGSEAGLSYLLDAIPYFGGKLSSKITSSILDKVDNVLARVAIKMGSNFVSEALEEGLQAVLEPWFKEVATNIQQDRPDWEEVAYESLLGGLSGLVLGSPGNIAEAVNTSRAGQQLIFEGVTAQDLTNLGLEFDSDSSQYGLAQRVNDRIDSGKKVNSYTMGRMWQDFSTETTAQNTAALTQALQERGLSEKQANNLVEYFFSLTEEAQAIVMENSRELSDAVQEVLLNPESQSGRRTQAYNAVQRKLSGQSEVKATAKEEPKISKDGQTYRTDTGEAVESLQIESVGNGKISYKVGDQTLGKEDIEYSSEQEAMLHDVMSSSRTLTVQAANFMAQHVDPNNPGYINEAIDSYQAGWYGYSESKLDSFTMPKSQSYELYAYGKKAKAEYEAKQKQAQDEAKAAAEAGKKPKGTSGVYFTDMKGHTVAFDEAKQHLTPKQEAGVDTAKFLNKLGLGGEFVFFRSERINGKWMFRDSKGNLHNAPNGMYIGKDGRIYIDLNTFAGSSGATLYTLAHELTHFIQSNAPTQYKVLADFLINEYDKTGKSMDERVKDKQKELEYLWDRDVSYDEAFHEVVADSMQKLFNDGNLQNELVKLKQSSPEGARVVQAIKDFLDKLIKRIRNIYAKLATGSEEAETVAQMGESLQKLQKIFAAALVEASDNYTAYGAVDSGTVQMQARAAAQQSHPEYNKSISIQDVHTLRSIGRKSVNQFSAEDLKKSQKWAHKYYVDLGAKSPFFRAWFGDWRMYDSALVTITKIPSMVLGKAEFKAFLKQQRGSVINRDTKKSTGDGWEIRISGDGERNTVAHSGGDGLSVDALTAIRELIENGILLDTEVHEHHSNNSKTPATDRIAFDHRLYSLGMNPDNSISLYRITIEEIFQDPKHPHDKRFHNLKYIEKVADSIPGLTYADLHSADTVRDESTTKYNVADLYNLVKSNDPEFNVGKPSSLIVNADGTPKVMYHGSGAQFTVFDRSKAKSSGMYGKGFYFTDSAEQAGVYGNLYSVFLNVKQPLQYGKDTVNRSQVRRFLESVAENEDYSIENYGTYDVNAILNTIMGNQNSGDAFQIIQDVSATAIGDMVEAAELFNSINNTKYDGIIVPTETVVFRPEQIKSATDNVGTFDPSNPDIRYQARLSEETSSRYLLTNALESAVQTDEERQKLQQYRDQIQNAEDLEDRLDKLNRRIFEYSFAPGPRDTAKLNEMRETAKRMARQLDRMDKRLLGLEATKPMKDLLERERKLERQRTAEKYREASQRRTEGRQKTELRHKVQKAVKKLNDLLLHESKDKHIPEGMKSAVSEILDAINMDTVDAESRIRDLEAQLEEAMKAGKTKLVQDISRRIDNVRNAGDRLGERIKKLHEEYEKIREDTDPVMQNAYDEGLSAYLMPLVVEIGDTPLRSMTTAQLQTVYDVCRAVTTAISKANQTFLQNRKETVQGLSVSTQNEVKSVGGEHIKAVTSMAGMKRFGWSLLKPIYAMRAIGSNTLTKLYENIRKGEDVWAVDVTEARDYYRDMVKKYGYDGWDLKKQYTFQSTTGREFQLNLEQIMSLYALSRRDRDQALEHLRMGGFVYDSQTEVVEKTKLGVPIKYTINTANAYNLSPEILAEIVGTLTKEQQGFVEEMQSYLSNELSQKGNTVSMALYDLKLFKEKNYFPLRSADQYLQKKNEPAGHVKLKNSGFSKKTTPRANNPIVLGSFTEVWSEHVNDMSMYHAFVLPIEDFNRVYNFNSGNSEENVNTESVKGAIQNAYGRQANNYINKLLEDINGGARSDPDAGIINKLVGLHKKGAVYLSASVVVQQPSAIARAQALIDPIHFIGPKIEGKRRKATWEEVKKWAPIALIKEMGRFDINMGKSTVEYIKGKEYDSFGEKFAGFFKDKNYREDILSRAPALADEISWCYIWNAVKRETAKQNPDLAPSSDAFFQKAGERFTEVITRTQVYDSVLSRSQIMRSKDSGVKMITSFYAEPNTSLNMAVDAVLQHKRGVKGGIRRTWGAVAASQILNAFLVSFVYAARDDDEDETYLEKYIGRFASEALDSFNPMGYLPILRDILSVFQGYTVERSDMTIVGDIIDAVAKLSNKDLSAWKKIEGMIGSVSQFTGIPVKNLLRDGNALYNLFYTGEGISNTTARGIWQSFVEELTKKDYSNARQLYSAVVAGDEKQTERVLSRYEDRDTAITAFQNVLRDEFEDGNIDTSDAEELLISFAGLKAEDAEVKVDYWETKNERGTDLTLSSYTTWYRELKDAGVTLDVYEDFKKQSADIESDKDKDGEPISGSKKKKIVALIDSLQIPDEQKDALYLSCNYAESTLNSTPWH